MNREQGDVYVQDEVAEGMQHANSQRYVPAEYQEAPLEHQKTIGSDQHLIDQSNQGKYGEGFDLYRDGFEAEAAKGSAEEQTAGHASEEHSHTQEQEASVAQETSEEQVEEQEYEYEYGMSY